MEENITNFEIASSPEELQASMDREAQIQTEAPVQEEVQEQVAEPVQDTPYVDPDAAPAEPQVQAEQTQQETQEFDGEDVETAVLNYLSERLGREISDFDSLSQPQTTALDERVEAISKFVAETGRSPEDWFSYQRLDPSEMDDDTAIRVNLATEYPNLTSQEINTLVGSKYKLDPDLHSEEEVQLSKLQMKIDAQKAKASIETMRSKYAAPEVSNASEDMFDETWINNMTKEVDAMTGLEFDLGNDKTFTFGLNDEYKAQLVDKNSRLDEYFDPYVREDGSWDYDMLSSHRAVIDNIDTIVSSAYRQGMSDGQRGIVDKAANVQAQTPQVGQTNQDADPVISQLKQIMGDGGRMTFKI
tara:strand:- start:250 stop:1326 length:1077 start_codon:yes stop_codon:yes gene_type:complete